MNPDDIEKEEEALLVEMRAKREEPIFYRETIEPMQFETRIPTPAETSPQQSDEEGKIQKKTGVSFPMPSVRPQAPQKIKEEGSVIVAKELAGQMGSAPEIRAQMRIDERKFAVLQDGTLAALSHFSYRHVYDGVRYWGHVTEWWLTGSQGLGGLARRHVLQLMANSSGVQSEQKAKKPNVIARNLWKKDWKQKAEMRGETVEEE